MPQVPELELSFIGYDDFKRAVFVGKYKEVVSQGVYKKVDGKIHYCTKDGEPIAPLSRNHKIVEDEVAA